MERLQKILAQAGYGSRRACEKLIASGRVRVDGKVAVIGQSADAATDIITLDGSKIRAASRPRYLALYKPRNVISSVEDPVGRRTVLDLVPDAAGLYPVGRLDWDSEGLILLTNDGALTNKLTHPRFGHTKEYRVLVARIPDAEQLATWRRGVALADGYKTAAARVELVRPQGKGAWLRITMGEGRKRQIREVGSLLGLPVVRIIRVRIGGLRLGALRPGQWRYLAKEEIETLITPADNAPSMPASSKKRSRCPPRSRQRGSSLFDDRDQPI